MLARQRSALLRILVALLILVSLGAVWKIYNPGPRLHIQDPDLLKKELYLLADDDLNVPFDDRLRTDLAEAMSVACSDTRSLARKCLEDIYWKDADFSEFVISRMQRTESNEERLHLMCLLNRSFPHRGIHNLKTVDLLVEQWRMALSSQDGWQSPGGNLTLVLEGWMSGSCQELAWMMVTDLLNSPRIELQKKGVMSLIHIYWRKDCFHYSVLAEEELLRRKDSEQTEIRELVTNNFLPLLESKKQQGGR